jgi:hypothetical protein
MTVRQTQESQHLFQAGGRGQAGHLPTQVSAEHTGVAGRSSTGVTGVCAKRSR